MTDKFERVSHTPTYSHRLADPEFMVLSTECAEHRGIHFCAASTLEYGMQLGASGAAVVLMLGTRANGLIWRLTCHGARELAESMGRLADQLEAQEAEAARELLTATLRKDPPA